MPLEVRVGLDFLHADVASQYHGSVARLDEGLIRKLKAKCAVSMTFICHQDHSHIRSRGGVLILPYTVYMFTSVLFVSCCRERRASDASDVTERVTGEM